ncbi:MAG: tungstate ABC transporter substrate-binding protein WtpA [Rikenellaceae bacterium]
MKRVFLVSLLIIFVVMNISCGRKKTAATDSALSGDLMIFHAGSLSMPFKAIADSFRILHPNVKILAEASGSIDAARKITELKRDCDIMASADYSIIDKLLVPQYAFQNIHFATNEMAIVYTERSAYADKIDTNNWAEILLRDDVIIGRADPDADPCGYRTVLTLKLAQEDFAEKGIKCEGLADNMLAKDNRFIRPKEVDLLALLDTRSVDYIFLYKSVAEQHHLKYLALPLKINLGDPSLNQHYSEVQTTVRGSRPGEKLTMKGEAMVYGVTILNNAPNKPVAKAFLDYLLSEDGGRKILKEMGQEPVR